MTYAPADSELLCSDCDRVLASFRQSFEVGDVPHIGDLAIHEAFMAAEGEPLRCPEHGPIWPRMRRPNGEVVERV